MDYLKHYENLINKRKTDILSSGYYEVHHIIPRCMGGDNSTDNLVKLKAEEHFIAHFLLHKIFINNNELEFAWYKMRFKQLSLFKTIKLNNKQFAHERKNKKIYGIK